ncbi:myosin-binding protein 7-like [Lycium barbarum]|uniref:myosin-binding protein 7-like n=1 Tax=Lycium barbarum TaxID=112863 RepID=UPI00293EBF3D|nr:myosin-binding protein 7-like [Lycium barbarum]XP_060216510.1 myosin-binding protein 7-like [Lycium barbarum]XP_060216511.1 myosin-binding protein 7-like [Lycium barbarum]XP_060216512.1 myosin-binding protein 7-like [Lycium barbarum]XP_060216513.1 myosin-binding protein 7-like [Lycium barbarum]XP_060216515.1 myosin-binding protein 7-like [Lycium barbarum]
MDSKNTTPSTSMVKCCDCECNCSSFSGTWIRTVKRKLDEYDETEKKFVIPGLILPQQTARIDMENECIALREMVCSQQETIQELSAELEEERNAASSAANEAMSMILRLQREKAESQMEFRQFKMFTEEKMAHDQQEMMALEDLLYKREQVIQSLSCEVQMYKHRMLSYGLLESEVEDDGEKEKGGRFSRNNSVGQSFDDGRFEIPLYDYPPLKCTINENQVYNEVVDVEKYAFGEEQRSCDQLQDLEKRINQLETSPRSQTDGEVLNNNVLEKAIVVTNKEMSSDFISSSPKFGGSVRKAENSQTGEYPNLRKKDESSEVGDEMSDRVYTIDSIHQGNSETKASVHTPKDSLNHADFGDPEVTKLYLRLQALEADRESMRQAIISMRTDKAQLILLKEIAQQLCKEVSPARTTPVRKTSLFTSFSFMSIFKWIISFVLWRRKARRPKYLFGLTANRAGLLMLLDKGPRVGQWRCLSSTQV